MNIYLNTFLFSSVLGRGGGGQREIEGGREREADRDRGKAVRDRNTDRYRVFNVYTDCFIGNKVHKAYLRWYRAIGHNFIINDML